MVPSGSNRPPQSAQSILPHRNAPSYSSQSQEAQPLQATAAPLDSDEAKSDLDFIEGMRSDDNEQRQKPKRRLKRSGPPKAYTSSDDSKKVKRQPSDSDVSPSTKKKRKTSEARKRKARDAEGAMNRSNRAPSDTDDADSDEQMKPDRLKNGVITKNGRAISIEHHLTFSEIAERMEHNKNKWRTKDIDPLHVPIDRIDREKKWNPLVDLLGMSRIHEISEEKNNC